MAKVQFNLLPDVKLEFIKTERTRHLVTTVSTLVASVTFGIFLLLFLTVNVVQKQQLNSARSDVKAASKKLQGVSDLGQVLTVENQLNTLKDLHKNKHIASNIFTYLPQITPTSVNISSLTLDFANSAMTITGTANNHQSVNTFIDTLKFTSFKVGGGGEQPAFTSVIESSFGLGVTNVTYSLNVQFDPQLFINNIDNETGKVIAPELNVPKLTTTRSILEITNNPIFRAKNSQGGQQ